LQRAANPYALTPAERAHEAARLLADGWAPEDIRAVLGEVTA